MSLAQVQKRLMLNQDDVEWFESTYVDASLGWIMSMLLEEFRKAHEKTPADLAKIGAAELKKLLEER